MTCGVLRSALNHAATEELVAKNVAALVKLPPLRRRKGRAWSSEEARRFLESAKAEADPRRPVAPWAKTIKGFGVEKTINAAAGGHGFPLSKGDELRAFVVGRAGIAPRRHLVSSILVDGDGDRASLRAYLQVVAMGDDGSLQVAVQGTYDDELVRTADGWRFTRRSFAPDTAPPA